MAWFISKQMKILEQATYHFIKIQKAAITDLDGEFLKTHGANALKGNARLQGREH